MEEAKLCFVNIFLSAFLLLLQLLTNVQLLSSFLTCIVTKVKVKVKVKVKTSLCFPSSLQPSSAVKISGLARHSTTPSHRLLKVITLSLSRAKHRQMSFLIYWNFVEIEIGYLTFQSLIESRYV